MQASRKSRERRDLLIPAAVLVGIPIAVIVPVTTSTAVYLHVSEGLGLAAFWMIAGVIALAIVAVGLYTLWRFFRGDMTRDDDEPSESVLDYSLRDDLELVVLGGTGIALWLSYLPLAEGWVPGLGGALAMVTGLEFTLAMVVGALVLVIITVAMTVRGVVHLLRRLRGDDGEKAGP